MEWNWLFGLLYGLLSGFFEFLPVSPQVHQSVYCKIMGLPLPGSGMMLTVHMGALLSVILSYYGRISKLRKEQSISAVSPRKRIRHPDITCLMELRLLKVALVPVFISCLLIPWFMRDVDALWLLAIFVIINGFVVLLPQYLSRANKDARALSPLDSVLIGLGGMLGSIPGFSRVGVLTSISFMRGADSQFGLDFAYLLSVPALIALCISDLGMLVFSGNLGYAVSFLPSVFAFLGAFGAGVVGIKFMHFFSMKNGYENLSYYNCGLAIFTFIIYLIG